MKVDRRRALVTLASASLITLALPSLTWADDDDDDRHRNNVQDEPGMSQGQRREVQESNNGIPESERPDPFESDKDWIFTAASGNLTEVTVGQLAMERSTNQDVKRFAQRLMDDHGAAYEDSVAVARTLGVDPPTGPAEDEHKQLVANLAGRSGSAFDQFFARAMEMDHRTDVQEYEMAQSEQSRPVGRYAAKWLPGLREHLMMAEDLAQKLGVDTTG
jgi:putative membrane protein